jgi:nitric oxide dioxygenase
MLDTATVQIIKATVPALQMYANDITSHMYPLLFAQHPEVLPFFNQTNQGKGTQPKALANAVIAYGVNIDELGNLSAAISKIVQKHTALGILPDQYDAVGSCLLQAIKAVLGDAATDEVIDAWAKAYGQLANILIAAEETIYSTNEQKTGSWRGEREFILVKRVDESAVISSFYFQPFDDKGLPSFEAGQFLTLVFDDIDGVSMRRNYSLSDAAGKDYLRISVKREPNGVVSNHLHTNIQLGDKVKLRAPSGDFTLRKNNKPLILLTAGVGITPAISMLNTEAGSGRDIRFIHAAINSDVHAFKHHVDQLATIHGHIKPLYIYSQPDVHCQPHATGFIDASMIAEQLPADRDVEFYLLGPSGFMKAAFAIAMQLGVPESQIHYEFFGPSGALSA